jgi:hypothetical protein
MGGSSYRFTVKRGRDFFLDKVAFVLFAMKSFGLEVTFSRSPGNIKRSVC